MQRALSFFAPAELPLTEWLRGCNVLGCALALILAGRALPF